MTDDLARLRVALDAHGLKVRGVVAPAPGDLPPSHEAASAQTLVLVGHVGSSIWDHFAASPEFRDAMPDPLDRWSRRLGSEIAQRFGALALFPFGGPPHHPFQRWAVRAGAVRPSPLGVLIDREFGLWHAYRFALALPWCSTETASPVVADSPCVACAGEPCLRACPVGAFSAGDYLADGCVSHLSREPASECMRHGCMARLACPAGKAYRYRAEHARFHMESFLRTQSAHR